MKKLIIMIFMTMVSTRAFACSVSNTSYINLAISTVEEKIFSYDTKNVDEKLPGVVISNCKETAAKKRFVMITFGPDVIGKNDSDRGTNFDKEYVPESCSIENNPLNKIQSNESVKSVFESRWKFIDQCVELTVTEMSNKPLSYPLDQEGCKITRLTSQTAIFTGGYCFFKPSADSYYHLSTNVKESCKSIDAYKEYGLNLQDFEAGYNYYTSLEYKDEITDLSSFGSSSVRLSVNPRKESFLPSDDFGLLRPTFPGNYPLNDVHMGKIEINNSGNNSVIFRTPLIVNNYCKSIEKDGIKSSICDYATPYVADIKLFNSKGSLEAFWYDGGVAPAQWQGILNGQGQRISKDILKSHANYKMEILFSDPNFEFNNFKKIIVKKIKALQAKFPSLFAGSGLSDIPEFQTIDSIPDMLNVGEIGEIGFPAEIDNLDSQRKKLGSYFSTTLFPPTYSKACHPETGACQAVGGELVKFIVTFKVNEDYSISNLEVERVSKILGSYKRKLTAQPEYVCN